jgi:hypothetical protein
VAEVEAEVEAEVAGVGIEVGAEVGTTTEVEVAEVVSVADPVSFETAFPCL